jgi:hypothetical protein
LLSWLDSRYPVLPDKEQEVMTQLLERAIKKIQGLPETEQDAIASLILDELADEKLWDETFARSQDKLSRMAEKVRADIRAGKVKDISVEDL